MTNKPITIPDRFKANWGVHKEAIDEAKEATKMAGGDYGLALLIVCDRLYLERQKKDTAHNETDDTINL